MHGQELFQKHFNFQMPTAMIKAVYKKKKNNELVNVIESGLSGLKTKIVKMSEDEKELNRQVKQ